MITKDELLQGRDKAFASEYTEQISENLDELLTKLNKFRDAYGVPMKVTSGWRPASINHMIVNAAPKSNHMVGLACDFFDADLKLWQFCLKNLQLLKDIGLWMEDKRFTPTWVHLQSIAPHSGKRIFIASAALPPRPDLFDGRYDSKFDSK